MWSIQYLSAVHPVTCSLLWVPVFDWLSISDSRGKWPLKCTKISKIFPDSSTGHRSTFRDQIWWKSAVAKFPKFRSRGLPNKKNSRYAGLVPAHILSKMGRSRPKFPERCHPLTCRHIPNFVRIGCVLPDLLQKDWFFGPKSQYNIIYAFILQIQGGPIKTVPFVFRCSIRTG